MFWLRSRVVVAALAIGGVLFTTREGRAADTIIYNDGFTVVGKLDAGDPGVPQDPVPTSCDGVFKGNFRLLETYEKYPDLSGSTETLVNTVANTYIRPTYLITDTSGGDWGTSVVGTFSYRTAAGPQLIPKVATANVTTGGADRLRFDVDGSFGTTATSHSTCTYPKPSIGSTVITLTTRFQTQEDITLDSSLRGKDAFRLMGLSSSFLNGLQYDANAIRWKDPGGTEHFMPLSDAMPRDAQLFSSPIEIATGGYFELVKGTGSSWNPTSSSVRVDVVSLSGITGRIGIQGWLAKSTDPNDDSLTLWPEWIDAPPTIPSGTTYEATFTVTATPPEAIPEPATLAGTLLLLVCSAPGVMRRCRSGSSRATTRKS